MTHTNDRLPGLPLRRFRESDIDAIARLANEKEIASNLRDAFPHPYTRKDAESFVEKCTSGAFAQSFAITVDDEVVGGAGLHPRADIERCSAEIGYWLGKPYWGRGLATLAVRSLTLHALENLGLLRVFALPFEENIASARVLEKAGFVREGVLRNAAIKEGRPRNMLMYAFTL